MNKELLNIDIQDYIFINNIETSNLIFSKCPFDNVDTKELVQQIESRKKIEKKLPLWFSTKQIFYPKKLNLEQTSSYKTAQYKASILKGETIADLTGGFGIDSYYFSEKFKQVDHFEHNPDLSEIAAHNFNILKKTNISCTSGDSLSLIDKKKYDVIYLDPSRRHESKGKVFFLNDCEPNVPKNFEYLLERCNTLLIKTSPMLDITVGLKELSKVVEIHIVAVNNEVKELLWVINSLNTSKINVKTVNIKSDHTENFDFTLNEQTEFNNTSLPLAYLYEPNAAIMKSGAFHLLKSKYAVNKLQQHTHLYTSDTLIEFPGRRFKINEVVPYSKKEIKKALTFSKANISIRNFPESVELLRKKWKIKSGGDVYLFFTTTNDQKKVMLICSKENN